MLVRSAAEVEQTAARLRSRRRGVFVGVTVSGGAESIAAEIEDLYAVAQLFDRAAGDAEDVLDYVTSLPVRMTVGGYGWVGAIALDGVLDEIRGPWSLPPGGPRPARLGGGPATVYSSSDHSVLDAIGAQFAALRGTRSVSAGARHSSPPTPSWSTRSRCPPVRRARAIGRQELPDGHPVVAPSVATRASDSPARPDRSRRRTRGARRHGRR